jgi:hypothetical protein
LRFGKRKRKGKCGRNDLINLCFIWNSFIKSEGHFCESLIIFFPSEFLKIFSLFHKLLFIFLQNLTAKSQKSSLLS